MKVSTHYNSLRQKIISYYFDEGRSFKQLADEFGLSPTTLKYWIDNSARKDK